MPRIALLAAAIIALAAACTSDTSPSPTPAATATYEVTAIVTPTPKAPATPSATAGAYVPPQMIEVLNTVWLIDLLDDTIVTIAEDDEDYPASATFNLAGFPVLEYWRGSRIQRIFDVDGAPLGAVIPQHSCQQLDDDTIELRDREYVGIACGLLSPNDRWMLYAIDAGTLQVSADYEVPLWDQWLIDLETNERTLLHAGMRHCGGCDGRFAPQWSASGRYIYFSELYGAGEVFLTDAVTGETRLLASGPGATDIKHRPTWSPTDDRLLYVTEAGDTILEDLEATTTSTLTDIPWPAWFDASGRYLYTPAYEGERLPSSPRETVIFDADTGQIIATREGTPPSRRLWGAGGDTIVATSAGFVAALERVVDCRGTTVYPAGNSKGFCVEAGFGATISPDGTRVALAVRGDRVPTHFVPGDSTSTRWLNDIIVVDIATGEAHIVATDAVSDQPPKIEWNSSGTQLLVRWPASYGI